ncbi:unnamed protein product, partial [Staurois parvus]
VSFRHSGSLIHRKSQRCRLGHVISCVQSQLITWDMYTDHQSTDDQCALMICVAQQRHLSLFISASSQCSSMPCTFQHPSVPHQYHISAPISATSMPHFSTHQCHINATFQHPSVPHQCHISVPI